MEYLVASKRNIEERRRKGLLSDFIELGQDLLKDESLHHSDREVVNVLMRAAKNRLAANA